MGAKPSTPEKMEGGDDDKGGALAAKILRIALDPEQTHRMMEKMTEKYGPTEATYASVRLENVRDMWMHGDRVSASRIVEGIAGIS